MLVQVFKPAMPHQNFYSVDEATLYLQLIEHWAMPHQLMEKSTKNITTMTSVCGVSGDYLNLPIVVHLIPPLPTSNPCFIFRLCFKQLATFFIFTPLPVRQSAPTDQPPPR